MKLGSTCSCIDCYTDANGEHRCRCDLCRPVRPVKVGSKAELLKAAQRAVRELKGAM